MVLISTAWIFFFFSLQNCLFKGHDRKVLNQFKLVEYSLEFQLRFFFFSKEKLEGVAWKTKVGHISLILHPDADAEYVSVMSQVSLYSCVYGTIFLNAGGVSQSF